MKINVKGEKSFSVLKNSFAIYSPEAFTLQISVDGVHFTSWNEQSPAQSTIVVNGVPEELIYKLSGVSEENIAIIKY